MRQLPHLPSLRGATAAGACSRRELEVRRRGVLNAYRVHDTEARREAHHRLRPRVARDPRPRRKGGGPHPVESRSASACARAGAARGSGAACRVKTVALIAGTGTRPRGRELRRLRRAGLPLELAAALAGSRGLRAGRVRHPDTPASRASRLPQRGHARAPHRQIRRAARRTARTGARGDPPGSSGGDPPEPPPPHRPTDRLIAHCRVRRQVAL